MTLWTTEQHQRLIDLVLAKVGEGAEVIADGMAITGPGGGVMGLSNLAKVLKDLPESEWERSLEPYLQLFQGPPAIPQAFADARRRLRIRLAADASDPGWAAYRPVCDGLDQMLVLTTDCGAMTISDEQIEKWGVPADEVWAEALDHTIWDEPRDRKILDKENMRLVWVRNSFYASSALLSLDHLLSPANRFGAVVMVPVRDALLYTEVNDEQFLYASAGMIDVGGRWYVDDSGPISADLFWYRRTEQGPIISRIVKEVNRRYQPCWGPDFSAALAELSKDLALIDGDRRRHRSRRRTTPTMPA